jgi:hypothetical protein
MGKFLLLPICYQFELIAVTEFAYVLMSLELLLYM